MRGHLWSWGLRQVDAGASTWRYHGVAVIELDEVFWVPGLPATPRDRWADLLRRLVERDTWILDGDLGPYDFPEVRLRAADTIIFRRGRSPQSRCRQVIRAIDEDLDHQRCFTVRATLALICLSKLCSADVNALA
jgi:hypothetical protein